MEDNKKDEASTAAEVQKDANEEDTKIKAKIDPEVGNKAEEKENAVKTSDKRRKENDCGDGSITPNKRQRIDDKPEEAQSVTPKKVIPVATTTPVIKEKVAIRISGRKIAKELRNKLKEEVSVLHEVNKMVPHLCVFLVGSRKDSETYVRMKTKACAEVGIKSTQHDLPGDTSQDKLIELVNKMNKDPAINGILIQLPLPKHIDEKIVLGHIAPHKDVDGLLQFNNGDLYRNGVKANLIPCTPLGCIHMLDYHNVQIEGAHAVVIGRSALVGKPMALLLLSRNATVTMCHSRTKDIASLVSQADIVVAAVGRPKFVKGSWLKPGAIVIDVGINAVDDASKKRGYRLVGDVEYAEARKVASMITPVPGGVGPMTVAMLLNNTIKGFKLQHSKVAQK